MASQSPQVGWSTVTTAANFLGITPQAIRQTYLPRLGPDDVRRESKPQTVRVAAIVDVMVQQRVAEVTRGMPSETDPLLADADSPGLERYRLAKAKLAELDLETRKGQLIERDKARDIFSRWAVLIRRMGERLSKRHGADAAATVNETLEECRAAVIEVLEE